jgi:hypothetical protein
MMNPFPERIFPTVPLVCSTHCPPNHIPYLFYHWMFLVWIGYINHHHHWLDPGFWGDGLTWLICDSRYGTCSLALNSRRNCTWIGTNASTDSAAVSPSFWCSFAGNAGMLHFTARQNLQIHRLGRDFRQITITLCPAFFGLPIQGFI